MATLITGGTGLIGTAIAEELAALGEPVVCYDIAPDEISNEHLEVVAGDIADYDELSGVVEDHTIDRIAHTAAIIGLVSTHGDPTKALRVNAGGTDNVFRAAVQHDLDHVVWASTLGIYGPASAYPTDAVSESAVAPAAYTVYDDSSFYRALKQLNEFQARVYREDKDVDAYGVRPSVVFGPKRDRGWLGRFIEDALAEGECTINRPPDARISLVYMTDVARLFVELLLADAPHHDVYNTGGNDVSARELADIVEAATGATVHCNEDAPPKSSPSIIENGRAVEEFDYAVTPLDEAIRDYIERVEHRR